MVVRAVTRPHADLEFAVERRFAVDDHAPDTVGAAGAPGRPVQCDIVGHPVDVLDGDDLDAVDHADTPRIGGTDGAGLDHPNRGREIAWGGLEFAGFPDL